jgi:hypothetical protein
MNTVEKLAETLLTKPMHNALGFSVSQTENIPELRKVVVDFYHRQECFEWDGTIDFQILFTALTENKPNPLVEQWLIAMDFEKTADAIANAMRADDGEKHINHFADDLINSFNLAMRLMNYKNSEKTPENESELLDAISRFHYATINAIYDNADVRWE